MIRAAGTGRERGSATLELVIIVPGLLLLIGLLIAVGRRSIAAQAVDTAARDAARQASIARTTGAAQAGALASARATLSREGLQCAPQVSVDVAGLNRPVGTNATVTAHVTCRVRLADLMMPGFPGTTTLTSVFVSPVDPYRGLAAPSELNPDGGA